MVVNPCVITMDFLTFSDLSVSKHSKSHPHFYSKIFFINISTTNMFTVKLPKILHNMKNKPKIFVPDVFEFIKGFLR